MYSFTLAATCLVAISQAIKINDEQLAAASAETASAEVAISQYGLPFYESGVWFPACDRSILGDLPTADPLAADLYCGISDMRTNPGSWIGQVEKHMSWLTTFEEGTDEEYSRLINPDFPRIQW
mgnify:CR=1 FL=1|jgi:hypothetical protein